MVHFATAITFAATLIGFAMSKDHSSHNCCIYTNKRWEPMDDMTRKVCRQYYQGIATLNEAQTTCNEIGGISISGDEFYDYCQSAGTQLGFGSEWQKGAGYRGTC